MGMPSPFATKVVGVSFVPGYPNNVIRLQEEAWLRYIYSSTDEMEPLPALLVRNPDNEHDPNAIEVHVPLMGSESMVGHLPRNVSSRLAPLMDADEPWEVEVTMVAVHADNPHNPGIHLRISRQHPDEPF